MIKTKYKKFIPNLFLDQNNVDVLFLEKSRSLIVQQFSKTKNIHDMVGLLNDLLWIDNYLFFKFQKNNIYETIINCINFCHVSDSPVFLNNILRISYVICNTLVENKATQLSFYKISQDNFTLDKSSEAPYPNDFISELFDYSSYKDKYFNQQYNDAIDICKSSIYLHLGMYLNDIVLIERSIELNESDFSRAYAYRLSSEPLLNSIHESKLGRFKFITELDYHNKFVNYKKKNPILLENLIFDFNFIEDFIGFKELTIFL